MKFECPSEMVASWRWAFPFASSAPGRRGHLPTNSTLLSFEVSRKMTLTHFTLGNTILNCCPSFKRGISKLSFVQWMFITSHRDVHFLHFQRFSRIREAQQVSGQSTLRSVRCGIWINSVSGEGKVSIDSRQFHTFIQTGHPDSGCRKNRLLFHWTRLQSVSCDNLYSNLLLHRKLFHSKCTDLQVVQVVQKLLGQFDEKIPVKFI